MDQYTLYLIGLVEQHGYIVLLLALALESTVMVGFVCPGLLVLVLSGFLAGSGTQLELWGVLIAGVAGMLLGDNLSYCFGRWGVRSVPRLEQYIFARRDDLIGRAFRSRLALLLFQFPFPLRVVLPAALGSIKFPFRQWLAIDLGATLLFVPVFALVGYVAGATTRAVGDATLTAAVIQYAFLGLLGLWIVRALIKYHQRGRAR